MFVCYSRYSGDDASELTQGRGPRHGRRNASYDFQVLGSKGKKRDFARELLSWVSNSLLSLGEPAHGSASRRPGVTANLNHHVPIGLAPTLLQRFIGISRIESPVQTSSCSPQVQYACISKLEPSDHPHLPHPMRNTRHFNSSAIYR